MRSTTAATPAPRPTSRSSPAGSSNASSATQSSVSPRTYSPTTREGNRIPGKYYKPWWEYRAKVVRDFIARVRAAVDELQPDVRLEYWAGSWLHAIYANGQNWGSPRSTFSDEYLDTWATPGYKEAGFADLLDVFITGTYLERVWGSRRQRVDRVRAQPLAARRGGRLHGLRIALRAELP